MNMDEKLKYMLYGAVIFLFLQMFYVVFLQETNRISWEDSQTIGNFLMFHILIGWGALGCITGLVVCLVGIAFGTLMLWCLKHYKPEGRQDA